MAIASPLQEALEQLYARFAPLESGDVARYIPELARADPDQFGICVATADGHLYSVGDASLPFSVQSVSKPFTYGLALQDRGIDEVLSKVGLEPSGEAFNAISLEPETGRPRNPMINAGAIATASLVAGSDGTEKLRRSIDALGRFAGRSLDIDHEVYRSESETGHRNRAIAYLLRNAGIVSDDVDEVLERYFMLCSVLVNCQDLALMAATLANAGINPASGERVLSHEHVERVMSIMSTCGMYDYAGSWLYRVGMPAKSGVSGGVIAVLPGQLGIGVFSPRLDTFGNSVRGVAVCEALSAEFGLHLLRSPVNPAAVVMTQYSLAEVNSKRRRSEEEMRCLNERGGTVRILRLQGPLVFSTAEVALRQARDGIGYRDAVLFDCRRVQGVDPPIAALFRQFAARLVAGGGAAVFAGLREGQGWESLMDADEDDELRERMRIFSSLDAALEWCEDRLLLEAGIPGPTLDEMDIAEHPSLSDLDPGDAAWLRSVVSEESYSKGSQIVRQGEASDRLFLLTKGRVGVYLGLPGGDRYRIATMGPGAIFGELALLDDQPRTADIDAETDIVCYSLPISALSASERVRSVLVQSLARDLAARLRRANTEVMALAS